MRRLQWDDSTKFIFSGDVLVSLFMVRLPQCKQNGQKSHQGHANFQAEWPTPGAYLRLVKYWYTTKPEKEQLYFKQVLVLCEESITLMCATICEWICTLANFIITSYINLEPLKCTRMFEEANLSRGSCQWEQWLRLHQCHQPRLIPQAPSKTKWQDSVRLCTEVCRYCITINNRPNPSWQHVLIQMIKPMELQPSPHKNSLEGVEPARQKANFLKFSTSSPKIKWTPSCAWIEQ